MIWLLAIAAVFTILVFVMKANDPPRPPQTKVVEADAVMVSPCELAAEDPVEALLRYGTPADADRLADEGVDLTALGYKGHEHR